MSYLPPLSNILLQVSVGHTLDKFSITLLARLPKHHNTATEPRELAGTQKITDHLVDKRDTPAHYKCQQSFVKHVILDSNKQKDYDSRTLQIINQKDFSECSTKVLLVGDFNERQMLCIFISSFLKEVSSVFSMQMSFKINGGVTIIFMCNIKNIKY